MRLLSVGIYEQLRIGLPEFHGGDVDVPICLRTGKTRLSDGRVIISHNLERLS
jgi:hypothetical protein